MDSGGTDPRLLARSMVLLAALVVAPGLCVAEQPPAMARKPGTATAIPRGAAPTPGTPRAFELPRGTTRAIEGPGEPLQKVDGGRPPRREIESNDEGAARAVATVNVALQPTWDRGFWVLPPGGLTRYLLLPPEVIDIDDIVAWQPRFP